MVARRWLSAVLLLPLLPAFASLTACGSTPHRMASGAASPAPAPSGGGVTETVDLDKRPFRLYVPPAYQAGTKAPLVVVLHGYQSTGAQQEAYFKLVAESDRRGFLYAMPDGTVDQARQQFWNASDACCNYFRSGVDDSGYLSRLLATVESAYTVDTTRVYLIGHSNGGFMAYRMACDHADQITAIVSLAGAMAADTAACKPARPVSVLQIHGTGDGTIAYDGGELSGHPFPAAADSVADWRRIDGCADQGDTSAAPLDLDTSQPGAETTVTAYSTGCRDSTRVELWTAKGSDHVPALTPAFPRAVMDFLYARTSP